MSVIRRRSPVVADADLTRSGGGGRRHSGRSSSWAGRVVRCSLIVAAGTGALALAGPFALRPFVDAAGAAGTAGEVSVAFVLDFGGSPDREVIGCVTVPASDNRYEALAAFTAERGVLAPTYNSSGLLCSINGDPSSGCGRVVAGGYIYWSYFTGGPNGWVYADTGASGLVGPDDVEGWRFQDPGTGLPNDPPPRTAPHYDALCSGTSTPTTSPVASGGGGFPTAAGAPGAPGGKKTRLPPDSKVKAAKAAKAIAAAAATPCPSSSTTTTTTTTTTTYPPVTTTTLPVTNANPDCASSSTTTTPTYPPDTTTSLPGISIPPDPETGVVSAAKHDPPSAGPDPLILGGLLVALLAIAAYAMWRRRQGTP